MIRLSLPFPPRAVSPNSRGHWRKGHHAAREYRNACFVQAAKQLRASQRHAWERATAEATVYVPDLRRRDRDNLAASLKALWDGLVDAGVLADDYGLRHEPLKVEMDRENPRVEVVLRPLT